MSRGCVDSGSKLQRQRRAPEAAENAEKMCRGKDTDDRRGCAEGRERVPSGSPALRIFKGRNFRRRLRGGSQWNMRQLSRCVLSGPWSLLMGQCQGSGSFVIAAGLDVSRGVTSPGLVASLGLELKHS